MKTEKKKILIVTSEFPPQPGGIGNHAYHLALYFSKHNYNVSVITDQRSIDKTEEQAFDKNLPFNVKRISLKGVRILMYLDRLFNTFKAFKNSDCVIATGKFSLWNVAFVSIFFKLPTAAVIHGTEVNLKNLILKKAIDISLKCFNNIVAVSNYTKDLVSHLNREIVVIPNGIDIEKWHSNQLNTHPLKGLPVLTTVGRVSTRKGQLNTIRLLPQLLNVYPEAHYHCIGIPTEAQYFNNEAKKLGVDGHVSFHGAVSENLLKAMLLATDVFVMLSSESKNGDVEGFGIAILEANAIGVPSVGSRNCGIEDAILNGKSGFLISNDNFLEFEQALESIIQNPKFYKNEAKKWAQLHSWDKIITKYIIVIEGL